nr:MAG TPA: hypothetical protein [Bacteriophage sp.]
MTITKAVPFGIAFSFPLHPLSLYIYNIIIIYIVYIV